jgi:hypothetical protein
MTAKKKIFIVAGNLNEFDAYKQRKLSEWSVGPSAKIDPFPEYVYVSNANQLKGLTEIEGYFIGTYALRTDLGELYWTIKAIKGRKNNVDNLKNIANAAAANGANGISGKFASSIINDEFQPVITTGVGTMLPHTMLPIGSGGTISNINTTAVTQYSYPNPDLEQRTKALETALDNLKNTLYGLVKTNKFR